MNLGERIKAEREKLGYSQTDFAGIAGASKHAQINWEKGVAYPNAQVLMAWDAAGVDTNYIITGICTERLLTSDETALIELFRGAPLAGKAAAVGALQGVAASKFTTTVHGNIGQHMQDIGGDVSITVKGGRTK